MKKNVVIIGAGGFGREILDVIDACNQTGDKVYEPLGFIVDAEYGRQGTLVNGLPILGGFDWLKKNAHKVFVTCGVGAPHQRLHLVRRAKDVGCSFFSLVHPSAIMTRWIRIGEGVVIAAGTIFTNQIQISNHVHVNLDCTIGHDVVLKDFVTIAPGVHVSGNTVLGNGCHVGTGVNILERLHIGEWTVIGAGSTIIKDVPANTTVVGVPGSVIKTREPGWQLK